MTTLDILTNLLDVILPLATMGFGIYGATNDTKPKDGKITSSGKIAIWGIIITALLSVFIKTGNLWQKNENLKEANRKLIIESVNLRKKDSLEQVFKNNLDTSLTKTVLSLKHLSGQGDTSLRRIKNLGQDQQELITNSLRNIQPLRPLEVIEMFTLTENHQGFDEYYSRLNILKNKLEAKNTEDIKPGISFSYIRGSRSKIDYIRITDLNNPFFPKKGSEMWNAILASFSIYISPGEFEPKNASMMNALWIGINPKNIYEKSVFNKCDIMLMIYFSKKQLQITFKTSYLDVFEDNTNSIYSIFDLQKKYLSINGTFNKGFQLDQIHFSTGQDFWHRTRFFFKNEKPIKKDGYTYYTHFIDEGEIK